MMAACLLTTRVGQVGVLAIGSPQLHHEITQHFAGPQPLVHIHREGRGGGGGGEGEGGGG